VTGYHRMKKGKKMPSIELEGHSDAHFALIDGKIVRVEGAAGPSAPAGPRLPTFERPLRE